MEPVAPRRYLQTKQDQHDSHLHRAVDAPRLLKWGRSTFAARAHAWEPARDAELAIDPPSESRWQVAQAAAMAPLD